jgi:hypothetical protein
MWFSLLWRDARGECKTDAAGAQGPRRVHAGITLVLSGCTTAARLALGRLAAPAPVDGTEAVHFGLPRDAREPLEPRPEVNTSRQDAGRGLDIHQPGGEIATGIDVPVEQSAAATCAITSGHPKTHFRP